MKKNLLILILLAATQIVFSQIDYRKGYIITSQGDTVYGLINYREGVEVFKLCQYKSSEEGPATEYTPQTIKGYGFVDDKIYETRNVISSTQVIGDSVVFYEVITRGPLSLFRNIDEFYIQKGDTLFYWLYRGESVSNKGVFPITVYGNKHIGLLNLLMSDSPETMKKIPTVRYNELSLTRLVEFYNNEKGQPVISYKSDKPWLAVTYGLSGGALLSKFYVKQEHNLSYVYQVAPFSTSTSPFADFELTFSSPRLSEHFALRTDFMLYREAFSCVAVDDNTQTVYTYTTTIRNIQLKIPVGLSYTFNIKKFNPYINLAFATTLSLHDYQDLRIERESNNVTTTSYLNKEIAPHVQTGFLINVGAERAITKKMNGFIELRYDESFGYNPDMDNLRSKTYNYQVCAGIRIKK